MQQATWRQEPKFFFDGALTWNDFTNKRQQFVPKWLLAVWQVNNISWLAKTCILCCCTCSKFGCVNKVVDLLVFDHKLIIWQSFSRRIQPGAISVLFLVQVKLTWLAAVLCWALCNTLNFNQHFKTDILEHKSQFMLRHTHLVSVARQEWKSSATFSIYALAKGFTCLHGNHIWHEC